MADVGGVDASIPLRVGQGITPPQNPLVALGQFANIQNALNQNRLFPETLAQQKQKTLNEQQSASFGLLAPLMALPPEQWTHKMVTDLAALGEHRGYVTQPLLAHLAAAPAGDGAALSAYLRPFIASQMQTGAESRLGAVTPTIVPTNVGNRIVPLAYGAAGAVVPGALTKPGGEQTTTLSPEAASSRVTGPPGPGGAPTTVPLGTVTPPALSGLPDMGTGRIRDTVPGALRNPNAPQLPAAALPGQITTGPGMQAAPSIASFQRIAEEGEKARTMSGNLLNMQNDLTKFTSGTNAERVLGLQRFITSYATALGVDPKRFGDLSEKTAAHEAFNKLAAQIADAQGAGSDARLHVNQAANPSDYLSPTGADLIIRQLLGNTDYTKAQAKLAAAHLDQTNYPGFQANVAKNLDPRVFQYNRLTPEQKVGYYNGIKDDRERAKLRESYDWAKKNGLLGLPDGG